MRMEPSQSWGRGGEPQKQPTSISVCLLKNAGTREELMHCTILNTKAA